MGTRITAPEFTPEDVAAVGRRMRALRQAPDLSPSRIADGMGIERPYWSRCENGRRLLTLELAVKIRRTFPATLDYLYLGRVESVPESMAARLRPLLS